MRIVSVVGARPQFVKSAAISRAIERYNRERNGQLVHILVHTGQHYDPGLSDVFFKELEIPEPARQLGVGSGPQGWQTGMMMAALESALPDLAPDVVVVMGDTNSTLAAALTATKMHIPFAHVEAGVRSYNRMMPEEINRVVTDNLADLLLCPSEHAVDNLRREGIVDGVSVSGDVMLDVLRSVATRAADKSLPTRLNLEPDGFALATVHRAENAGDPVRLRSIFEGLRAVVDAGLPVVLPLHPRTRAALETYDIDTAGIIVLEPVGYGDMLVLQREARVVLTDSGGMQKESVWLGTPCLTLRDETEWVETIPSGWNRLVGVDPRAITAAALGSPPAGPPPNLYGDGDAATKVVEALVAHGNV